MAITIRTRTTLDEALRESINIQTSTDDTCLGSYIPRTNMPDRIAHPTGPTLDLIQ